MTDPAEIDLGKFKADVLLDPVEASENEVDYRESCKMLIAAVEALRERVAELERDNIASYEKFQLAAAATIIAEERVAELEQQAYVMPPGHHWRGECGHDWRKDQSEECPVCRAEAAEACVTELRKRIAELEGGRK